MKRSNLTIFLSVPFFVYQKLQLLEEEMKIESSEKDKKMRDATEEVVGTSFKGSFEGDSNYWLGISSSFTCFPITTQRLLTNFLYKDACHICSRRVLYG